MTGKERQRKYREKLKKLGVKPITLAGRLKVYKHEQKDVMRAIRNELQELRKGVHFTNGKKPVGISTNEIGQIITKNGYISDFKKPIKDWSSVVGFFKKKTW